MSDGHWQMEGAAAELFERYLVPAITEKWAEDLLDRAQPRKGAVILDIACGTGIVARLAAKRMGRGLVTGLDLNTGMLAVAQTTPTEGAAIIWIGAALSICRSRQRASIWSCASKDCNLFQTNERLSMRYAAFSRAGDGRR